MEGKSEGSASADGSIKDLPQRWLVNYTGDTTNRKSY